MTNLEQEIKESKVRLCLDCGKCTSVCPVAKYDAEFNPRLIIQKTVVSPTQTSTSDLKDTKGLNIWSCLNCQMCIERCNYQVKFTEFVLSLRNQAVKKGSDVLCNHGGMLQNAMRLMAHSDLKQERLGWVPDDIVLNEESDTCFFVGCGPYFDEVFSNLEVKTLNGIKTALRILNKTGISFKLLANERCCGRDLLLQGDKEGFLALARANLMEFGLRGIKRIITYCPECYSCLKLEYPKALGNDEIEIVNLIDIITPLVKDRKLTLANLSKKVTYHDPCTLGRGMRIFDAPRDLLQGMAGLELVEMEHSRERALCCGSSPWAYCSSVNRQIQDERLAEAATAMADILVTACPKCQIHLKCAQKNGLSSSGETSKIEIRDLISTIMGGE